MKTKRIFFGIIAAIMLIVPIMISGCNLFGNTSNGVIKIYSNPKTEYLVGAELDLTDAKIEYTDSNGQKSVVEITTNMVTSFNTSTAGENREMIITYKGYTTTVKYNVKELVDIDINAVYYSNPSNVLLTNQKLGYNTESDANEYYDYVRFVSNNAFEFSYQKVTPNNYNNGNAASPITCTASIVNNKKVYTANTQIGTMEITVLSNNKIKLKGSIKYDGTPTIDFEFELNKYVFEA